MSDQRIHTKFIFALVAIDVNFAYWPLLQLLLSPNARLNDGVFKFVVSLA